MKKNLLPVVLSLICLESVQAQQDNMLGVWRTVPNLEQGETGTADIEVQPCKNDSSKLCGYIVAYEGMDEDKKKGEVRKNKHTGADILGETTLRDMTPTEDLKSASGGQIYSSRTDKTYSLDTAVVDGDQLKLRACFLFFCQDVVWNRVK